MDGNNRLLVHLNGVPDVLRTKIMQLQSEQLTMQKQQEQKKNMKSKILSKKNHGSQSITEKKIQEMDPSKKGKDVEEKRNRQPQDGGGEDNDDERTNERNWWNGRRRSFNQSEWGIFIFALAFIMLHENSAQRVDENLFVLSSELFRPHG